MKLSLKLALSLSLVTIIPLTALVAGIGITMGFCEGYIDSLGIVFSVLYSFGIALILFVILFVLCYVNNKLRVFKYEQNFLAYDYMDNKIIINDIKSVAVKRFLLVYSVIIKEKSKYTFYFNNKDEAINFLKSSGINVK